MRLLRFVAAAVLVACLPAMGGILTGVSILNIDGIAESSLASGSMTTARAELTGAGATVTDKAIGSFSASDLTGITIVYVGLVSGGFTAGQITAIQNFVNAGGGLVAVGTERDGFASPTYEQLANAFGLVGAGGDRAAAASAADPTSPIVNGPFGVATTYAPSATGAFATIPGSATVVWRGADTLPIIVTLAVTGRAFFFADTNFMENFFIGNGNNSIIWGNAFAFTGGVSGGAACPAHEHGHVSTASPGHFAGIASPHAHHAQHGTHLVPPTTCPPHAFGHSAGLTGEPGEGLFSSGPQTGEPGIVVAVNQDGAAGPLRRGEAVALYGSARWLFLDAEDRLSAVGFTPPASGQPLYYTTTVPEIRIGGVPAKVLFSGLAPGLTGVWQINVEVPEGAPSGRLPVQITYGGENVTSVDVEVK